MKILGIETSCDETAAAVVEDGYKLLSNVIQTQIDIHVQYGGVVPEIAARSHIEVVNPVINRALKDAGCIWDDIDAIAVTYAPGLMGSLLVGTLAARTLAIIHDKPLYAIHHVEAHVYANFLTKQGQLLDYPSDESTSPKPTDASQASGRTIAQTNLTLPSKPPEFPILALIVSGGHTQLVIFRGHGDFELLGQTQDDAVGEAFDKVAKIIGLPYPGGPSIAKAALSGNPHKYQLPKAKLHNTYDFSFSGLKTALLRSVQRETGHDYTFPSHALHILLDDVMRADFAASFQQTAVETLVDKTERAFHDHSPASVVIAGGVAANEELRRQLQERLPLKIEYAPMQVCTDNGAMIATLAYYYSKVMPPADAYDFEVIPSLSMSKTTWAK